MAGEKNVGKKYSFMKLSVSRKLILFSGMVILFSLVSCGNKKVYEKYIEFDDLVWNRFNILKFEVPVEEADAEYDILITIRHLPGFKPEAIPVNFTVYFPSGEMRTSDINLQLVGQEGKRLSKCLGDLCDITLPLRKGFRFTEPGVARLEIENKWTKLELRGVMEVGLTVIRTSR